MNYIVLFFLSLVVANGLYIESVQTDRSTYRPGDTIVLNVNGVVVYSSQTDPPKRIYGVQLENSWAYGSSSISLGNFEVQNGIPQRFSRIVALQIPQNAKEGVYVIDLKISGYLETERRSSILLTSYGGSVVKVEYTRQLTAEIGDRVISERGENRVKLCTNRDIKNVRIRGPFLVSEYYVEEIKNCSDVKFEYVIGKNRTGDIDFPLEIEYETSLNNKYRDSFVFKVNIEQSRSDFQIEQIGTVTNNIGSLRLRINYTGRDNIRDLKILSRGPVQFIKPNYISLQEISRDPVELEIETFYGGSTGVVTNEFLITYVSDGVSRSVSTQIPIKVFSKARIDVYVDAQNLNPASPNNINIVIGNLESYTIQGVRVRIDSDRAKILTQQRFVGEILPNDYASEKFSIIPEEGLNNLIVTINYRDSAGNQYEENYEIPIRAEARETETKSDLNPLFIVLIVAGSLGLFLIYRKWKK
ncbi:MAG: hypothetical protein N3C61_00980 [Candidatus Micrarchaeota archaeon]|nr:hypothetical protein [Candidatus Micrarchaeota archaeon]